MRRKRNRLYIQRGAYVALIFLGEKEITNVEEINEEALAMLTRNGDDSDE